MNKEVAVYKGEDLLCIGTIAECANELNVKKETIMFYATPSYIKRARKHKGGNTREVVYLE